MDLVVCNFPPMWPWFIPAAPALLLGAGKELGLECDFVDIAMLEKQKVTNAAEWAKIVLNKNPKLIAFSLFSYLSQPTAKLLASEIRKVNSDVAIIIGGSGIKTSINDKDLIFVNQMLDERLINFYHDGDSDQEWPKFLINFFNLSNELPVKYYSDFSKYKIEFYQEQAKLNNKHLWVPINSSKGCIRKCTFCDIHQHWKFSQRDPDDTAEEIRQILKYIPNGHLNFTDSLVNGSMPAFNRLLDHLINIKKEYPDMCWTGQFIIRNEKTATEEYWKRIGQSGAYGLQIGVETGSDRLRADMRKNFTNQDLHTSLLNMEKYNVTCTFLMIVGYPTETEEDFLETVNLLRRYSHYAGNTIQLLQLGQIMTINPGTPVYEENVNNPDMILTKDIKLWFNKKNPTLTFEERIRRRDELEKLANNLNYPLSFDNHTYKEEIKFTQTKYQKVIKLIEKIN